MEHLAHALPNAHLVRINLNDADTGGVPTERSLAVAADAGVALSTLSAACLG